jgi:hypothetical protein
MNVRRIRRPSPAFVLATVALFVGLGGTAGAVATQAVPLAKRALTADNAKKLGGKTSAQIASQAARQPGPASSAAGLVAIKTGTWSLGPGSGGNFTVTCDSGRKAISGGWADPADWSSSYQSMPTGDGSGWTTNIWSSRNAPATQSGTVYAICLE